VADPTTRPVRRPEPARIALPRSPASVGAARRFIRARTAAWSFPAAAGAQLELIGSELVTNAVLHARTELTLTLELRDGRVRISVEDRSRAPAALRHYQADALTGRGLGVVAALSERWGSAPPPTARSSGPRSSPAGARAAPPDRPTCATPRPRRRPPRAAAPSGSGTSRSTATWSWRPTTTPCSASSS
jgi:anti-sigma regulatory factor (Ser/Thr protein kinase)